ncbi:hypothetical protein LOK49_LG03G00100 [Camellia lanceoleosa]|uniref:Uncharacterized protein n=1 Tax=Camellia lanceoleosa TaxID=1840588 RepID=A0ACC0IFD8_9ERIC|nr:hypothetical protein LOK49_LG03G00100 [Camellia lanceoleosa]
MPLSDSNHSLDQQDRQGKFCDFWLDLIIIAYGFKYLMRRSVVMVSGKFKGSHLVELVKNTFLLESNQISFCCKCIGRMRRLRLSITAP